MKIVYIAGGKYKSFYLNHVSKILHCDLIIFNFNILYPIKNKKITDDVVGKELIELSQKLSCDIIAGLTIDGKYKLAYCKKGKIVLHSLLSGVSLQLNNYDFIVGGKSTNYKGKNKIVITNNRIVPNLLRCSKNKLYVFCDAFGVSVIINGKMKRKFSKCSKITLT